jgi:hypothetical protein
MPGTPVSAVELASPNAFANKSLSFPSLPGFSDPCPDEVGLISNCRLCLARLDFVGDAKDGLRIGVLVPSCREVGIRPGVVGASTGTDVVGDVLRRFGGGVRCIIFVVVYGSSIIV